MIDGSVREFIEKLYYEDHYILYCNEKYYFNGCCSTTDSDGKVISVKLAIYNLSRETTVYAVEMPTADECIEAFENAPIWDGKTFWDVEDQMTWVDE